MLANNCFFLVFLQQLKDGLLFFYFSELSIGVLRHGFLGQTNCSVCQDKQSDDGITAL